MEEQVLTGTRKQVLGLEAKNVEETLAEIVPMLRADFEWDINIKRTDDSWRLIFSLVE